MEQDVFLSHASKDKQGYVEPLASALKQREVTFWLDSAEIGWGDNVTTKINEGLRNSRYAVVCLSANFLDRPWPENELSAVLALQNTDGRKRVLPLILNSKEQVLQHYPLIAGLAFRPAANGKRGVKLTAVSNTSYVPEIEMPASASLICTGNTACQSFCV
jgi:hypothetical protein